MNVLRPVANLVLRIATVAVIALVTLLILVGLHSMGVPLHLNPVIQVLAVACGVAWRLYRGRTPIEEIRRFLHLDGPIAAVGLRSRVRPQLSGGAFE